MRCGTTYLAVLLDEHPEICFTKPIVPEAKFFLLPGEYEKGKPYYERNYFPFRNTETQNDPVEASILGEKTIHYSEREDALIRIREWYPDSKHILITRDPVLRALSHYFFSVRNGIETRSLTDAFLLNSTPPPIPSGLFISPFRYIEMGGYLESIKKLTTIFPKEDVRIIIGERFFSNPTAVQSVYRWLSVDESFHPPSLQKRIFTDPMEPHTIPDEVLFTVSRQLSPAVEELKEFLGDDIPEWNGIP